MSQSLEQLLRKLAWGDISTLAAVARVMTLRQVDEMFVGET